MRLSRLALLLVLALPIAAHASETPAEHAANVYAQQELDANPRDGNIPDYSLTPDELVKMHHLVKVGHVLHFASQGWDIVTLILLLSLGTIGWMRDKAVAVSKNRWIQGYTFLLLYLAMDWIFTLPMELYYRHLELQYGLSVQSWGGWYGDAGKSFVLDWIFGGLVVMLLFWLIRKFPRNWWLACWLCTIPIVLFLIFALPYVNYLFNHYEPLQKSNPELVARLEQVVEKNHLGIPPERMFLMKASEKVTTMNADVEGFGASKRVVVWDNTIQKMTPDEILVVFGHESGHYVLNHIAKGVVFAIVGLFIGFFLAFHFIQWTLARFGARWRVSSQSDWAALAVLVLAFTIFGSLSEPVSNTWSRSIEHQADVFGLEAVHGLVANPQAAGQGAFIALGKIAYSDPNPDPLYEFWVFNHPGTGRRAAFAKAYDPWAPGMEPKYFPKEK